jgi:hypothetical protein
VRRWLRWWRAPGRALLLAALGCSYDPKARSGFVDCDPRTGWCPAGLVCALVEERRVCVTPGSSDAGPLEEITPPRPDAAAPDRAVVPDAPGAPDLAAPELAGDVSVGAQPDGPPADVALSDAPGIDRPADLPPAFTCPSGPGPTMVAIESRYCIDSTEVTHQQYFDFLRDGRRPPASQLPAHCAGNDLNPDDDAGWSVPVGRARFPVNHVDWCDAYTYCAWAGKRLCGKIGGKELSVADARDFRVSQWVRACTKGGTQEFPYPGAYDPARCDTGKPEDPDQTHEVGRRTCEGGYPGIFDMSGNVQEWIDLCTGADCFMMGGSYAARNANSGEESHCQLGGYPERRTNHWAASGFRCCSQ